VREPQNDDDGILLAGEDDKPAKEGFDHIEERRPIQW